jgi:hypothetical protein
LLRDVIESDVPVFFEHRSDPLARQMALFPARDRQSFTDHWKRILSRDDVTKKTIVFEGRVAGNIVVFELHAYVARSNVASIRVLEKCGFVVVGHETHFDEAPGEEVEEALLELR